MPFPGAALLARLIDTLHRLPTFLVALAFTFVYGSAGLLNASLMEVLRVSHGAAGRLLYSAWGVMLAEVTVYTPFILRPLLAAFSLIESAQIEVAASLGAGPWRIMRQIILPAALPALLAGGSLCLLLTVNEFGIVLFIGAKGVITLPLLVYDKAIQEFDYTVGLRRRRRSTSLLSLALYSLYRFVRRPVRRARVCWSGQVRPRPAPGACWRSAVRLVYAVPLAMIALASITGQWNGVLPSHHASQLRRCVSAAIRRAVAGQRADRACWPA